MRQLLFLAARHLDSSQPIATIPAITTVHDVVFAANISLTDADDVTPVMLLPENTSRLVRKVQHRMEAHEKDLEGTTPSSFLKVCSPNEGPLSNLLPPTAKSRARMERLRKIAAAVIDRDPYFITRTAIYEFTLAVLPHATLELRGDESPAKTPTCVISGQDTPVVWDTGNHITAISFDVISPEFQKYLLSSVYESKAEDAKAISVDAVLRFTNADVAMSFPARVVSHL